ncbi:MAG: hypothetical protein LUO89_07040 [Methanothrix sp.]|nr:hypothetical protein [Methanothrix sp.]
MRAQIVSLSEEVEAKVEVEGGEEIEVKAEVEVEEREEAEVEVKVEGKVKESRRRRKGAEKAFDNVSRRVR